MKLIDKLTTLTTSLKLNFTIEQSGWYLFTISGRVKSAQQLGKGETDDEDLRIEMDGQKFPQLSNLQRYLDSIQESIHWGVRWLYHKAQFILNKGGRDWLPWEDAVAAYNGGGDWKYQKKIYKIYQHGVDSAGTKFWSLLGLLILAVSIFGALFLYLNQGKFYISRGAVAGTQDFRFYINVWDRVKRVKFPFSHFYANGLDLSAFYKGQTRIMELWSDSSDKKTLAVFGRDIADYETVTILTYENGHFRAFPKLDQYSSSSIRFNGHWISLSNLDNDPEEEVVENFVINYSNAPDELRKSYYDWDDLERVYRFQKMEKSAYE